MSLTRGLFRRKTNDQSPDDGGINGQWGHGSPEDENYDAHSGDGAGEMRLRGGASHDEYETGDDSYFSARPAPRRAQTLGTDEQGTPTGNDTPPVAPRPFHRTPTGLSVKQLKKTGGNASAYEVNLEGGLDVSINVEVNPSDPAGITVPYRLLVPRLFYEYEGEDAMTKEISTFKRLLSFRRNKYADEPPPSAGEKEYEASDVPRTPQSHSRSEENY